MTPRRGLYAIDLVVFLSGIEANSPRFASSVEGGAELFIPVCSKYTRSPIAEADSDGVGEGRRAP